MNSEKEFSIKEITFIKIDIEFGITESDILSYYFINICQKLL